MQRIAPVFLLVVGFLLIFSNQSYAQCDTLLADKAGMRLRFCYSNSNPADTIDVSESLRIARNFKVVRTLVANDCSGNQIDSLMAELKGVFAKITIEEKARLHKQQPGPWVSIGVIIRFNSVISLSHLFTVMNRFHQFYIEVDLINNEILVSKQI